MANPSKAGAFVDDPTICRCISLTVALGFPGFTVVNWVPYISSKPVEAREWVVRCNRGSEEYEVQRWNLKVIAQASRFAAPRIVAWGNLVPAYDPMRKDVLEELSRDGYRSLWCFGRTKSGEPKHPMARGSHRIVDGRLQLFQKGVVV